MEPHVHDDMVKRLEALIVAVPDFPKAGILFRDFTPMLADARGLALAVELMANPYRGLGITTVVGAESRGFIFGTAIAQSLSAGFVPVRKGGKLPRKTRGVTYQLEYGTDRLEIHEDAMGKDKRVLIVDDLLATGGTLKACCELVAATGAAIGGITVLIELPALNGREKFASYGNVHSVLRY